MQQTLRVDDRARRSVGVVYTYSGVDLVYFKIQKVVVVSSYGNLADCVFDYLQNDERLAQNRYSF